ncbi:glycosyltransferase family 8 protein [Micromonospora sp. NPDC050397]|uniref:glycosyltransferase family 8 protein n=1 Tax=Micromonospora sp. NPDC050397 TaxID=3364279 RepID=UPI0038500489
MHLFYCANEPYLFPMAVSLFSAIRKAGSPLSATLAVEAIEPRSREALSALFPATDLRVRKLPPAKASSKYPVAMFARLLIDKMVPKGTEKALYLDSDTLVLEDVHKLDESIPADKIVSAVQDDFANRMHGWEDYFNSGVICVDVSAWRNAGIGSAAMSLVVNEGMSDQHALNTVLAGQWTRLDPRWNVMTHLYTPSARWAYATSARQHTAVRHFTMYKPWLSSNQGLGAASFHAAAAELREVDRDAWEVLKAAAVG